MKLHIHQDRMVSIQVQCLVADEQVLVIRKTQHRVPRTYAHATVFVKDAHQSGRKACAGSRIPRGWKRRLQWELVLCDNYSGNSGHFDRSARRFLDFTRLKLERPGTENS